MRMESCLWHHPPGRVELVGKDVALNRHHLAESETVSEGQIREGVTTDKARAHVVFSTSALPTHDYCLC